MKKGIQAVLLLLSLLLLFSLACSLGSNLPFGLGGDGEGLSQEEIATAATRAAEAAATAAAVADQGSQAAATAAADSVATAEAELNAAPPPSTGTSLEQKLTNIQPDANGNFSVSITEADLNEFVAGQGGSIDTESLKAQDIQFNITPEYLQLNGDVTEPIALPLDVRLRPVISGDKLRFELISATAGLFPIPDSMLNVIETVANSELSRALISLPSGVTLQNATLGEGEFTVFGHQN